MKKSFHIFACATALIGLSGCQSILGTLGMASRDQAPATGAELFGDRELTQGRKAMDAGNIAEAIKQFRLAAINDRTRGDAFNALGVAYARLQRPDLAERYFQQAVTEAPDNMRYLTNMQRFYGSDMGKTLMARRQSVAAPATAEAAPAVPKLAATTQNPRTEILVNTSSSAVQADNFIRTAGNSQPARREIFVSSRSGPTSAQNAGAVQVTTRTRVAANSYPARVRLPTVASRAIKAPNPALDPAYPVRVEIGDTTAQP